MAQTKKMKDPKNPILPKIPCALTIVPPAQVEGPLVVVNPSNT